MVWLFSQRMSGSPGHKACYNGSPVTSVRKANFVVKVVLLECCEKTVCLVPEITDIVNSGQTQRKCFCIGNT